MTFRHGMFLALYVVPELAAHTNWMVEMSRNALLAGVPRQQTVILRDHSVRYLFNVHRIGEKPAYTNCVYVFAKDGLPLYIGKAEKLAERLSGHEKLLPAILIGANQLFVHSPTALCAVTYSEAEERLIGIYNPPLNDKFRTNVFRSRT